MPFTADAAAHQIQERLKNIYSLIHDLERKRNYSEPNINNIIKTHDKLSPDDKVTSYYQQKLKNIYNTAILDAHQEEDLLRKSLEKINEIRLIRNERRIQARNAGNKETIRRGALMKMLLSSAQTLPLYIGKSVNSKPPPLCGSIPAESTYIAKMGDMVAALVKGSEEEENWILAEVVSFNPTTNKYEVDDIDEEQKDRHTLSRRRVVPLPLMRANPETDSNALFMKEAMENEVVIIDHLSGHRVHLSNFFWTGVNDAPSWIMLKQLLLFFENKGVNNFLPTNTLDESKNGFNESLFNPNIPFCKACVNFNSTISEGEENIGVLIGDDPGPRYWLITILKSEKGVPPKIELRLARLYHLAFRRQQQLHLGLYGSESQQILYNKTLAFNQIQEGKPSSDYVTVSVNENKENHVVNKRKTVKMKQKSSLNLMRTIRLRRKEMYPLFIQRETSSEKSMAENITESVENEFNISQSKSGLYNLLSSVGFDIPDNNREDITSFELSTPFSSINSENSPLGNSNKLKVEESLLKVTAHGDPENVNLVQVRMQDVAVMDNSNLRLIYSVHLGGKPVPAEIAAKDMSLLSSQEVALELGTPVLVQSTPYLNTTAPLALSRKRDVFILTGAAGISILLFIIIIIILIPVLKKKGSKPVASSVNQNNIKENREYIPKRLDHDYVMCTSETERDTIATSQSYSPNSRYVNMITPNNSDSLEDSSNDNTTENVICSKNNLLSKHNTPVYQNKNTSVIEKHRYEDKGMTTDTDPDRPKTYAKSNISVTDDVQKSVDKKDATSPCSYLSMKSCKKFPTVKSVEPLSKVLESMATKEVDIELDSLDQQATKVPGSEIVRKFWSKFYSSRDDPGAIGPIVWNLKSNNCKEIGQARQRLHELLEDSWTNAGKETEIKNFVSYQHHPASEEAVTNATHLSQLPTNFLRLRDSSSHMVSTSQPNANVKSTKLDESVQDTSRVEQHCSGTWGTRPLSAGPFHRPNLSDISKMCVSTNSNLPSEDPAVTIIDAIKQELTKFASK